MDVNQPHFSDIRGQVEHTDRAGQLESAVRQSLKGLDRTDIMVRNVDALE
jgi:hypothetical protein